MARPLRVEFANALYHITSRGNGRQEIFHDDHDNRKFLELLGRTIERYHWVCHTFCLMVNHYHLIIETPEANLSKGMHHLNANYCQAHHKKYGTVGHLFQGRFKAIVVDRENYLLELARYVVLNPVRAGLTARPEEWSWSSYRSTAGLPISTSMPVSAQSVPPLQTSLPSLDEASFLSTDWLLAQFGPNETAARKRYRDFVAVGIGQNSPWPQLQAQIFLGKDTFIDAIKETIPEKTAVREIPKQQRYAKRPSLEEIFPGGRSKKKRDEAMIAGHLTYGYEQKEIADFLGIHYTTVSRIISSFRGHPVRRS
jgi:REP element-mobilizing transposase RayT